MSEICSKCGLPKDLCVCETIAKEEQKIIVSTEKRKFGKITTLVKGIDTKKLKSKLACGGTAKDGVIELQGNHADRVKEYLITFGFPASTITTKGNRR